MGGFITGRQLMLPILANRRGTGHWAPPSAHAQVSTPSISAEISIASWSQPALCDVVAARPSIFTQRVDGIRHVCSNVGMDAKGRILAVDYGEKNIGLAYCDALGLTVQPMPSMPNCGTASLFKKLRAIMHTLDIQEVVLGIPFKMDGTRGDAALRMEQLMEELKAALKIPISGVDELLSTVEATEFWRSMNKKRQKKYRTVDSLAAALILERHLKEN